MPSNTIKYSSDVARRLTKGYGSITQPIYVKSDGTIGTCTAYGSASVASAGKWATARTLTIGATGKSVDGSGNVSWSLAEIGAAASSHTHSYLPLSGGIMTGQLYINYNQDVGLNQNGSLIVGPKGGENIGIDGNEIMARSNGAASTLYVNSDGGNVYIGSGGITSVGTITSSAGYLKSTLNGNTVQIGSQNSSFTHIYNSANIGFIFNNTVATITGNLGTDAYPWNNIYIGKANGAGIYYAGTKAIYRMIRFIDNTSDIYGNGISIGGGGLVVLGAGESADTILSNLSLTAAGGTETTYIGSDDEINFYPQINSWDAAGRIYMQAGRLWVGVNGNTTRENQIGVQGGAGQMYMQCHASTTGDRGIWIPAHGSGSAHAVFNVNTNNQVSFADYYTGTQTKLAYSQAALAASAISYLTCWNGYELRAINKAEVANAADSSHKWVRLAGDTMTGNLTISGAGAHWTKWVNTTTKVSIEMWSDTRDQGIYTRGYWTGSAYTASAGWILYRSTDSYVHTSFRLYGAVWNDYAETREVEKVEPGRVVTETLNGQMILSIERLQPGCKVVSDTYGFALGKIDEKHMPIAVAGRVLVYPYRDRNEYILGAAVCSAPNGTVDIMTREEIIQYPERIIGTVSEIPDYDVWSGGDHHSGGGTIENVSVNGRIWIYVR